MSVPLKTSTLGKIPKSVGIPHYDRSALSAGIVHIGVGNFHRAHQAMYMHELFKRGEDLDWAILGAGVKSYDRLMREKLEHQDWLTTVIELDEKRLKAEVCGAMINFIDTNPAALVEALSQQSVRIVSLTITEGGYFIDEATGEFNHNAPDIQLDIAHPQQPLTVFGVMIEALRKRKEAGLRPFTIMSCDNIPHNGDVTKSTVLGLANAIDSALAEWISLNVSFPNSMVDCIAPAVSGEQIDRIEKLFTIEDKAPVLCESYRQWVLEDNFVNGRPALENVGVQFVDDVSPYELMKLRILNGGHAAMAYPAALLGMTYAHEGASDSLIQRYLHKLVFEEIIPSLPDVPGIDLAEYFNIIIQRFSNPEIKDTIERLCQDGANRLPKFILPTITTNLEAKHSCDGLALVLALWCQLCLENGKATLSIVLHDNNANSLYQQALSAQAEPSFFLAMKDIFGPLSDDALLQQHFEKWLTSLQEVGVEATIARYIDS